VQMTVYCQCGGGPLGRQRQRYNPLPGRLLQETSDLGQVKWLQAHVKIGLGSSARKYPIETQMRVIGAQLHHGRLHTSWPDEKAALQRLQVHIGGQRVRNKLLDREVNA